MQRSMSQCIAASVNGWRATGRSAASTTRRAMTRHEPRTTDADSAKRVAAERKKQHDGVDVPLTQRARDADARLLVQPLRHENLQEARLPSFVTLLREIERRARGFERRLLCVERFGIVFQCRQCVGDLTECI